MGAALVCGSMVIAGCGGATQSGFLGDYSRLRPVPGQKKAMRYMAPGFKLGAYKKVMVEPVRVALAHDSNAYVFEPLEMHKLSGALKEAVETELRGVVMVVDRAGPGVLVVRAALTDVTTANVAKGTASKLTPVGLGLNLVKLSSGNGTVGVGSATIEAELIDGGTQRRVAAFMDKQIGRRPDGRDLDKRWENAEGAFQYWAKRFRQRLIEAKR
jgi:hypothetical protein